MRFKVFKSRDSMASVIPFHRLVIQSPAVPLMECGCFCTHMCVCVCQKICEEVIHLTYKNTVLVHPGPLTVSLY